MQLHHGRLAITFRDKRPDLQAAVDRFVYQRRFLPAGRLQYIIYHGIFIAGMANADAKPPEILGSKACSNILQAVVATQPDDQAHWKL